MALPSVDQPVRCFTPSSSERPAAIVAGATLAAFLCAGCSSGPEIPARGNLPPYEIATTVDHESARYYLENYPAEEARDSGLHQRIGQIHRQLQGTVPTRDQLRQISREFSLDFAALVFARQLLQQPDNAGLQQEFLANLAKVTDGSAVYPPSDVLIMFVPGYDYVDNGAETGADFARPRELLKRRGYAVHFVAIDPLGSVEANAIHLAADLRLHRHRKIVVVGASSAGPTIHLALGKLLGPDDLAGVQAWLNLGGILQGSPVLDKFSSGPRRWLLSAILWAKGWPRASFDSMTVAASRARFGTLSVPRHIAIYNYLGLSLSGDISRFARDKYVMMKEDGPNDGLTLLPDIVAPHSLSILSPTTDHFFAEDPAIDHKTLALLVTVVARLQAKPDTGNQATTHAQP